MPLLPIGNTWPSLPGSQDGPRASAHPSHAPTYVLSVRMHAAVLLTALAAPDILTDAQFMAAMKGLIDSAQAGPFSSGQGVRQSVAPFGGADLERYGISGLPHTQPSQEDAAPPCAAALPSDAPEHPSGTRPLIANAGHAC